MNELIGKQFTISGMTIEVIASRDESWECLNVTTGENAIFDKAVLERAIRLGQAEEVTDRHE